MGKSETREKRREKISCRLDWIPPSLFFFSVSEEREMTDRSREGVKSEGLRRKRVLYS